MTLYEMSFTYREDVLRFRLRVGELRAAVKRAPTQEAQEHLRRRIAELETIIRQSRELAELTQHYYERGYHRDERYVL